MEEQILSSVLGNFNFRLLDDPEFGEDSVREEIILPIIKGLGYQSDGPYKIIRSRKLLHPFVSIGSQKRAIHIIPDYILEIEDKPCLVLEAKGPNEDIVNTRHVEQAYSYAMHSEIKAIYFALCNGREFALYHVSEDKPILHFPVIALPAYWEQLKHLLSPETLLSNNHRSLSKDFGLHIKRLGFTPQNKLIFTAVPIAFIAKFNEDHFTFGNNISFDGYSYCTSYDFNQEVFQQLKRKIPRKAADVLSKIDPEATISVNFANARYFVDIECVLGDKLEENEWEIFLPLRIMRVFD